MDSISPGLSGSAATTPATGGINQTVKDLSERVNQAGQVAVKSASTATPAPSVLGVVVGEIIPVATTGIALAYLATNLTRLIKSCLMGLGQDIARHALNVVRDLIDLVSSVLAGVPVVLQALGKASAAAVKAIGVVSGALSAVLYLWYVVQKVIRCVKTVQVAKKMDAILENKDMSPETKVGKILEIFNPIYKAREDLNAAKLHAKMAEGISWKKGLLIGNFLNDQMKSELEETLGVQAYEVIKRSLVELNRGGTKEELFVNVVEAIRESREMLRAKLKTDVLQAVTYSIGLVATVVGMVFPAFGVGMVVGYGLWTAFIAFFTAEKIDTFLKNRYFKNEQAFFNKPPVSADVIQKAYATLSTKVHPELSSIPKVESKEGVDAIGRMLLSHEAMEGYVKEARQQSLENLKMKMTKRSVNVLHMDLDTQKRINTRIDRAKSAKELLKVWKMVDTNIKKAEGAAGNKWDLLQQRIKLLSAAPDAFFGRALREKWRSA